MGEPEGLEVDHINGYKLDNRKCNLRPCEPRQNKCNTPLRRDNTTGYKGVYASRGKYRAQLRNGNKHHYLGSFGSPVEAARAYDKAAREHFGEFAQVNFAEQE